MTETATFETRKDAGEGGEGVFKLWMTALDLAEKDEKDWRKNAQKAIDRYRDEKERKNTQFNILYSSIQTQEPAVYNSTPKPDVRRRFNDKDVTGKLVAQVFERSLSHCIDEYDFDDVMESIVHDSLLAGRGVSLVEYDPVVNEEVDYETVSAIHVQWDDFRRGPGKKWEDAPWIAVRYRITREDAIALNPKDGKTVHLDHIEKDADKDTSKVDTHDVFKRLTVWKIWDKAKREIVFIAPSHKTGPFAKEPDQLGLEGFFPMPRPLYDINDTTSLVPLVPYDKYRDQAEELDVVTARITSLVKVLKWRGIRPANIVEFDTLATANDGELVASQSMEALFLSGGNPDNAVWLMPIERLILVLRELYVQREQIKQVIFEISGLADIMRGETDPGETLGAQQIKAQWGSMRMQQRQRDVQRYARDLMRIKAEIIGEKFSVETLQLMTGIELPSQEEKALAQQVVAQAEQQQQEPPKDATDRLQLPTWDEVKQIMSSDALRSYRVDIETDSTIASDQTRAQQNMATFIEGLASFTAAIGPGVQTGQIPQDVASDILVGFSRNFKLGRTAEDALERLGEGQQQDQPDPELLRQQAEQQQQQAEQQMKAQELQLKEQQMQGELAIKREAMQGELEIKQRGFALDSKIKASEAGVLPPDDLSQITQAIQGMQQMLTAMGQQMQQMQTNAQAPIEITEIRENGRLVGAERRQGTNVTRVALN